MSASTPPSPYSHWDPETRRWVVDPQALRDAGVVYYPGNTPGYMKQGDYDALMKQRFPMTNTKTALMIGALLAPGAVQGLSGAGGAGAAGAAGASAAAGPSMIGPGITSLPATMMSTAIPAGAAAGATGGFLGMGVKDLIQLAPMLGSLFGLGKGNSTPPQNDAMNNLITLQTSRMQQADPLYQAILKMAMGLMPISARAGFGGATAGPTQAVPRPGTRY